VPGEDVWERIGGGERNLMRLMFHPEGHKALRHQLVGGGASMWRRAQREAEALGGREMQAVLDSLRLIRISTSSGLPLTPP